jgi:hypothetical protein
VIFAFRSRQGSQSSKPVRTRRIIVEGLESRVLFAVDASIAFVAKGEGFSQTGSSTVVAAAPGNQVTSPFNFDSGINLQAGGALNSASVTLPNSTVDPMVLKSSQNAWDLSGGGQSFNTIGALNAAAPNGTYHISVNAVHDGVNSFTLTLASDAYPAAPQITSSNYTALQNIDQTQAQTVSWNAFAGGTSNDPVQLKIYDSTGNTVFQTPGPGSNGALNGLSTSTTIPANTLQAGQTYTGDLQFINVVSTDTSGYPGVQGYGVFDADTVFPMATQGALAAPTGVAASQGAFPHHVQLTWSAVTGAASYQVFRSPANNTDPSFASKIGAGITGTFFFDTTATPGVAYNYWIRARNPSVLGPFSASPVSGFIPLAPPGSFSASQGTFPHHVALNWAAVNNASGYQVFRSTTNDESTATKIASGLTSTFFNDNTVTPGTTYFYWVRARNSVGVGLFTASASGFIP